MMNLMPYSNRGSEAALYSPFRMMDPLERRFFGDDLMEFRTDIRDDGDRYVMEADLPGFRKEDIQIDVDDKQLTIRAERHSDYEKKDAQGNFLRCERSYGAYTRSFGLSGIRSEDVEASYQDGVLKLLLPKAAPKTAETRRLAVQ